METQSNLPLDLCLCWHLLENISLNHPKNAYPVLILDDSGLHPVLSSIYRASIEKIASVSKLATLEIAWDNSSTY